ncbi:hypothetical protein FB471_1147 [Amycolatopsis cihanbeyliensis]|uniref:Uncharacterized protein n=1 Tax=Amycolatopsis cihanbeyliensis TaxID=1128664 RepID=A0A542DEI7_AMYCI|nr:hypothetical protein FB471_1147 [Amycolatopsis cihanbeyliensis]
MAVGLLVPKVGRAAVAGNRGRAATGNGAVRAGTGETTTGRSADTRTGGATAAARTGRTARIGGAARIVGAGRADPHPVGGSARRNGEAGPASAGRATATARPVTGRSAARIAIRTGGTG